MSLGNCSLDGAFLAIGAGRCSGNAAELLGSLRFNALLADLRARYDVVIVDSAPLLEVSDTLAFAPKTDGCLLVARWRKTPLKALRTAQRRLGTMRCALLGGIVNDVSREWEYRSYYYDYEDHETDPRPRSSASPRKLAAG